MYRRSDRGKPIFIGEPILFTLLAAAALWVGVSRDALFLTLLGAGLAIVAALSIVGWCTAGRRAS